MKTDNTVPDKIVIRLGEWIFPQKLDHLVEIFGEKDLIKTIESGLIMKSHSKAGMSVQAMRKVRGYVELTEKGWEHYKTITNHNL